ncbi:hypothetical protein RRF57_007498 [Xylaria bambusicola]|uniref:Uncharacterized protein n=1 Tax=Xylaria bambusicola TaxID=326684 RepID=A0AAN7UVA0_9PEZI
MPQAPLVPNHVVVDLACLVGTPFLEPHVEDPPDALMPSQGVGELGYWFDDVNSLCKVQEKAARDATNTIVTILATISSFWPFFFCSIPPTIPSEHHFSVTLGRHICRKYHNDHQKQLE